MLAEISQSFLPEPMGFASIGWVCVSVVAIIAGIRQGIGLVRDIKERPTGAEALREAHSVFASKADLKKLEEEFRRHQEFELREAELRRKGIYDRLDKSREEVLQRMDDTRKELEDKLKVVHARVDTIPDRIIATLRNTGAIE
jgi:vacuolar-type H+-ATPase subunit I/STV1